MGTPRERSSSEGGEEARAAAPAVSAVTSGRSDVPNPSVCDPGRMETSRLDRSVALTLSYDEAVVLFELLQRWETDGTLEALVFEDQAEQRVLWDLSASLEPMMDEVFSQDFGERLEQARAAVRDPAE